MSDSSIVASVFLALLLLPQPLMLLDALFIRLLARSIVRASDGAVDAGTASKRIRRMEQLTPADSARLFAAIIFITSSLVSVIATRSTIRIAAVAFLSVFTGWLGARSEDNAAAKVAAAFTGAAAVFLAG